ncbi:megakaryocyte and platelet inhibitory receptor G6b isoform X4 [Cavia porcellus]|uniref:megakaryocyte and platelet inhibitory receptor G6b isoform X4 n=1 Tax=Cavia porcellus TaxID=10141 RepID=UPI000351132E|nr:megakaryocyte and platelet inhibitory receptor G6b isoform X2 [Cavia porcellus]
MALVLQLLSLLLTRAHGDAGAALVSRPGDRVNLSCVGVSHPIRWAWAPSFPACQGLSKGRRPILWASASGIPTVPPLLPFAGRLRSLDPAVRRLELLVGVGDSGTFICKGHQEEESRTLLHVLGDTADCRPPGPTHGACPRMRARHIGHLFSIRQLCPPHIAPFAKAAAQTPAEEGEDPEIPGDRDPDPEEPSLLYADLDHTALRRPRRLSSMVPADTSTVYAVVV